MTKHIQGEITVTFKRGVSSDEISKTVTDFGLSVKDSVGNTFVIETPVGTEQSWASKFDKLPSVYSAQRHQIVPAPPPHGPQ